MPSQAGGAGVPAACSTEAVFLEPPLVNCFLIVSGPRHGQANEQSRAIHWAIHRPDLVSVV